MFIGEREGLNGCSGERERKYFRPECDNLQGNETDTFATNKKKKTTYSTQKTMR